MNKMLSQLEIQFNLIPIIFINCNEYFFYSESECETAV